MRRALVNVGLLAFLAVGVACALLCPAPPQPGTLDPILNHQVNP